MELAELENSKLLNSGPENFRMQKVSGNIYIQTFDMFYCGGWGRSGYRVCGDERGGHQPDADYIPGASGIRRGGDCLGQRYLGQRKHFKPCDRRGAGGSWYGYFGSKLFRVNC